MPRVERVNCYICLQLKVNSGNMDQKTPFNLSIILICVSIYLRADLLHIFLLKSAVLDDFRIMDLNGIAPTGRARFRTRCLL